MNLAHPKREPFMEVVLEDGRFARVRRPTRGDWLIAAMVSKGDTGLMMAALIASITTIDGEQMTLKDWMDADCEMTQPINEAINKMCKLSNDNPNRRGIA